MKKVTSILITVLLVALINVLLPTGNTMAANGKDHPLISRFEGSSMVFEQSFKWDSYVLPISKIKVVGGAKDWSKKIEMEGQINRIQYTTDKENNPAFVYANYLSALKKAGWEILFSGSGDEELGNESYEWQFYMFQEGLGLEKFGSKYNFRGGEYAYIATKYEEGNCSYFAAIYIVEKDDFTLINQDIIKVENPNTGLVTVKLLTEKLDKKGHLILDGVYFKTGSFSLTEQSVPALRNIADYLNAHKSKKFFIVGHTDNTGEFLANKALSENRAKAVMNELVTKYGVDKNQLKAYGISSLAPVTSNSTDKGRAKNRRVEIVQQ